MSPYMRLFFRARRAGWRAQATAKFLVRIALLALGVVLAIQVGQILVTLIVAGAAAVALLFILGAFTAEWRHAGVRVGQQYRRLTHRPLSGKDGH